MSKIIIPALEPGIIHRTEEIIKRSQFIVSLGHTPTVNQAKDFINTIKLEFPDATHNCWAYITDLSQIGYSDDGEPHGTAGKPMLSMLTYSGIMELTAVVTRYFGGTKLGTGGLVRAYQQLVKLGLDTLPCQEKIALARLRVIIGYSHITIFNHLQSEFSIKLEEQEFTSDVSYKFMMPQNKVSIFQKVLTDLTSGQVIISDLSELGE